MKTKKIISLLLMVMLTIGAFAFAGCGEKYSAEINWDVDLSKKIEINMLFPDTGEPGFGKDHTANLIEESTGYKANYREVADANADNEINNLLTTQANYHVMKLTEAQFHPYVITNTFLDLTELLERTEYGKILYQLIDLMPYGWDSVSYTDANGKTGIYGIPDFGYTAMEDQALVWNRLHLEEINWFDTHEEEPKTMSELSEALAALQAHFGATDSDYHALGLGGSNSSNVEPIMSAFDCPNQFYVDENGNIQKDIYSDSVVKYVQYMNDLRRKGILSDSWQSSTASDICSKFATEKNSVVYLPYWWVRSLCNTLVSNRLGERYGLPNTYQVAHDQIIGWQTRVRGDGSSGSAVQAHAKHIGDDSGVSYISVIPFYMAEDAVYIIDYLGRKIENFALYYGGKENVDWVEVPAPADGKEDYAQKIIYLQPYSYELSGKTVSGGGKWVQLTDNYVKYIVNNSQYCNGTNSVEAKVLFHLRETGFDAWQVAYDKDENTIGNPMTMLPVFTHWSRVSILSRTVAKRGIATSIDNSAADYGEGALNVTRQSLRQRYAQVGGVRYYYWSDEIVNEMTEWYRRVKLKE